MVQVDQIWSNSTVLDVLTSVPDYEECQALCRVMNRDDIHILIMCLHTQDKVGCEGWTWLSETSADYPNHCLRLSNLGHIENYSSCVREEPKL